MLVLPVAQKGQTKDAQLNTVLGDYRRKINEIIGSPLKDVFVQASEPRNVEAGTLWLDLSDEGDELEFLGLADTSDSYLDQGEKLVAVKATEDGLEFIAPPTGVDEFKELIDTPANYTGAANKFVKVNAVPDGLEFIAEGTIDHDALTNFLAKEHRAWEDSIAQNIHADNIISGVVTQHEGDIDHDALANWVASKHVTLPGLIASVLTDHDLAAHTVLGLFDEHTDVDHDQTTNAHANPYKLDDLAVPDDNTDLNVSITKHGLTPKAPNDITKFLRGDASWEVPSSGVGDKIEEGDSKVEVVDLGTGYIQTLADAQQVRKDQVLGNIQPLQPAFYGYRNSHAYNVTGDGTLYDIVFNAEGIDQGDNFNVATGIFTAPINGFYTFKVAALSGNTAGNRGYMRIQTSLQYHYGQRLNPEACDQDDNELGWCMSVTCLMDANDTARVGISMSGTSRTVHIYGGTTHSYTHFSGALLC